MCLSAVAPLIGRYCGTKIPPEIQSSSGLLSLSFHTDMAVAKDGFSARYNMTHKEVSDCECKITFIKCVFVRAKRPLCRFVYLFNIPISMFSLSRVSSPSSPLTLIFLSSSFTPLTLSIFSACLL